VIVDAVYAHAHPEFCYNVVYETSGEPNPMMGFFAGEFFSRPGTDFNKQFTRDFFAELNRYWLSEYHVDGFRYDYVPGIYDGPAGVGYAALVFDTYQHSKTLSKFAGPNGRSLIIQCAEHLPDPQGILAQTYSSCTWQNGLLDEAGGMARGSYVTERLAHRLDPQLSGYPTEYRNPSASDAFPVAPFQYLESHDHARFINQFGELALRDLLGQAYGDRGRFYKIQPFIIALYTGKGIPMLWNGQEFGENWGVPGFGIGRNLFERPLHWEYFYDGPGKALVRLHRLMGTLRRKSRALRSLGFFFYFFDQNHLRQGVIAYRREAPAAGPLPAESLIVVLNFSDRDAETWIQFPSPGTWAEQIDGTRPAVTISTNDQWMPVIVPSNYGGVYRRT
jgi:1,4-alpha-glucan branching enzyme